MKGRHYFDTVPLSPYSTGSRHRLVRFQQALEGGKAQGDDNRRLDKRNLTEEKGFAGSRFVTFWSAVSGRTALHHVRYIHVLALELHRLYHSIQQLTRSADERTSRSIFIGPGPLAYEHQLGVWIPFPENYVGSAFAQLASRAIANVGPNRL